MGVPTFCPIHLKIHECPENSNKAISSANETKIKAKMARMLNPTNTTESEKKQQAEKGTIQYILENATKNNSTIKNKLGLESEEGKSVGVDESDIKAKMARLRASSVNGAQSSTNFDHVSPTFNPQGSGLQEIIDHAYRINRGIERIKSTEEEKLTAATINFDDIDLEQLNEVMQEEQEKKAVSGTSKAKNSKCRTKTVKNSSNKTTSAIKKPKQKTTTSSTPKANNKTIVLTTDEIKDLIEKAVIKAMTKEKDNKKKRGS